MRLKNSGVIFRGEDHTYWLKGKQLQGITGLLGRQLFSDQYKNVPDHILQNAAERGTAIHNACTVVDMFGISEREESDWYAVLKKEHGFEVINSEYLVTDFERYASAIDKVIKIGDDVCLADIKTTYKLNKDYLSWQLSIYKYLFNLLNPDIKISRLYAIWLKNGAKFIEIKEVPENEVKTLLNNDKQ